MTRLLFSCVLTANLALSDVQKIPFACKEDDIQWAGLTCTAEETCPIFLDLSSVASVGQRLLLAGNIHSSQTTLYSVLLVSEDGGVKWGEPVERMRGEELDRIQMFSFETGWISGQRVYPLAGDPFLLLTHDGGKTWRKQAVLPEGSAGFIQKFWFDSAKAGGIIIDHGSSDGDQMRYQLYETESGGESWMIRESSIEPIKTKVRMEAADEQLWRLRADAAAKAIVVEKRAGAGWSAVATFAIQVAECKGESPAPKTPPPPDSVSPAAPAKDYVEVLKLGGAELPKKKPPK